MGEVVTPNFMTRLDVPADRVLEAALEADLEGVVILGYRKEDESEYFASSIAGSPEIIWLIERLKKRLLEMPEEDF